jgi:chromosome segregation ATPase
MSFDYQLPNPNFDRSKVKGLVASLITLPPEHADKAQALEMAAGGKLRNVVVADETVGKDLLQHGRLKSRVTIIPLNKIEPRRLSQQVTPFFRAPGVGLYADVLHFVGNRRGAANCSWESLACPKSRSV